MVWIIVTVLWVILMLFLSHQNGYKLGRQTRWISCRLHVNEILLRKSAHVIVYFVFSFLLIYILQQYGVRKIFGVAAAVIISIIDEITKKLCIYRHFSISEELLNIMGICIGYIAAVITFTALSHPQTLIN